MEAKQYITALKSAVKKKDKRGILDLFDKAFNDKHLNWETEPSKLFEEWDELTDKANNLIYNEWG